MNPVVTTRERATKALMVDVDGVLVTGRPEDGKHWSTSLQKDLGLSPDLLHEEFFIVHWEDVLLGRAALVERLRSVMLRIAPGVQPEQLVAYWFRHDSRLSHKLLRQLSSIRRCGVRIYLATNQEHMRADYLMGPMGLAEHVDGIYYSAQLGCKKPDRRFFDAIVQHVDLNPAQILLIDDALPNVIGAKQAGWHALHWNPDCDLRAILDRDAEQLL